MTKYKKIIEVLYGTIPAESLETVEIQEAVQTLQLAETIKTHGVTHPNDFSNVKFRKGENLGIFEAMEMNPNAERNLARKFFDIEHLMKKVENSSDPIQKVELTVSEEMERILPILTREDIMTCVLIAYTAIRKKMEQEAPLEAIKALADLLKRLRDENNGE